MGGVKRHGVIFLNVRHGRDLGGGGGVISRRLSDMVQRPYLSNFMSTGTPFLGINSMENLRRLSLPSLPPFSTSPLSLSECILSLRNFVNRNLKGLTSQIMSAQEWYH